MFDVMLPVENVRSLPPSNCIKHLASGCETVEDISISLRVKVPVCPVAEISYLYSNSLLVEVRVDIVTSPTPGLISITGM